MKKFTRLFAPLLLIAALILPLCASATYYESNDFSGFIPSTDIYEETVSLSANEIPEALLLRAVDSGKFVKRLYEMEDEYTLAFRNEDGTNTVMMFSEPVKYRTALGEMRDKSTQTIHSGNRYVTADTDVMVSFPDSIGQSVRLQYNGLTVSMKPIGVSQSVSAVTKASELFRAADTLERESSVYTYRKVYDNHTDIVYTPTFTGVKCDILLSRNTGKNRFDFEISLNGFHLEKNENEKIIYILNTSNEVVAYFNSVMSYDSVGKVSFGDMEFVYNETNDTYIVTLIVDEGFLNDTETVYPVYVDPSITVNPNQTASPTFEYMAVYKNGTSQHSSSYSSNDLVVGSDYDKIIGRVLYKLPDIPYKSLSNVTLKQCVRTTSTLTSMNAYPYTGTTWTSGSSYNSVANNYDSSYSMPVAYGSNYGTYTKTMTIDLTGFYNTGASSSSSYSIDKGIVLVNTNGELAPEYAAVTENVLITTTNTTASPNVACFAPYISMTYENYTIKVDGGHFEGQNSYPFTYQGTSYTYVEGNQMWKLQEYLVAALKAKGFDTSRIRTTNQPLVSRGSESYTEWSRSEYQARGNAAAGADLLVALHTNAFTGNTSLSRVVVEMNPNADSGTTTLGNSLAASVKTTMNITETSQVIPYDHLLITTAVAAGCAKAYIIEHSFHTNPASAYWLLSNANLQQLAEAEANAIFNYYKSLQ